MAKIINQILPVDGMLLFASEHDLKYGLFAHRLDREVSDMTDLIDVVEDTDSLNI